MLKLAINAQLPIVAVTTRDVMNLHQVIKSITKRTAQSWSAPMPIEANKLYTYVCPPKGELPLAQLYEKLVAKESTLILVNPPAVREPMFAAGEVPVPRQLMLDFITHVVEDKTKAEELLAGLGGCTLKEAAEFARLTMARDNSLTVQGLVETRKSSFHGANGLTLVDTRQSFYVPPPTLEAWAVREKPFFLNCDDPRLVPRGLLMDGPPGTGKTAASKWLAQQFGVPLYRVDIGGTKNKYVGQSEANLLVNLNRLDNEEPCIALLDEIEKVFGGIGDNDGGTTTTMLSQLLWWLAERRSRVLVVMTTNNAKKLPKELYREGRIDEMMWFGGLEQGQAFQFALQVLKTFPAAKDIIKGAEGTKKIEQLVKEMFAGPQAGPTVSQASITKAVYSFVKSLA